MAPRLSLALLLALIPATGQASWWEIEGRLHPQALSQVRISGRVRGLVATNRHGRSVPVALPAGAKLGDALVLPPGDWAELTLTLDGPLRVAVHGAAPVSLYLGALTVPLEDPEARVVVLDWSLADELVARLRAGAPETGLRAALGAAIRDGAIARP